MQRLSNKVAVVTGGSAGIGLGSVERLVEEGAQVMVGDIDAAGGAALAERFGERVGFQICDVTDEAQISALIEAAVQRFGGLDILFNNAGAGGAPHRLEEMEAAAWDATQALLLRSVVMGIRYAVPHMRARGGGSIINTASIAGVNAGHGSIAYSVAKAGVIHLTKLAAAELGRDNIRVNAICPGLILTNIFTPSTWVPPGLAEVIKADMRAQAPNAQPIPKAGEPQDVAGVVAFLASDDAAFVTGVHLMVDGGLFVGPRHAWDPAERAERMRRREEQRRQWEAAQAAQTS